MSADEYPDRYKESVSPAGNENNPDVEVEVKDGGGGGRHSTHTGTTHRTCHCKSFTHTNILHTCMNKCMSTNFIICDSAVLCQRSLTSLIYAGFTPRPLTRKVFDWSDQSHHLLTVRRNTHTNKCTLSISQLSTIGGFAYTQVNKLHNL